MKIKFIDLNKWLVKKVSKAIPHFECICDDIFNHKWVIVSASNPSFTFGWWLDKSIAKKFPNECAEKQSKKGWNERIWNVIFTITVDDNIKSSKELIWKALQSIMMFWEENETILLSWLGTSIWWLSEEDFIDVLKDFFPTKAYKGMNNWMKCRWYQFELGKTFKEDNCKLCNSWFHYCEKLEDIYLYYDKWCDIYEIEIKWQVDFWLNKCATTDIKILKKMSSYDIMQYISKTNTGNWNTGNSNTGYSNTGNSNTGNSNTGNSNTGYWNTGNWNTGNSNTGYSNIGNRNTGNRNTGDWNTGNSNTGNSNTGNSNTGYRNTGNSNTGDWNTGDWNTGDRNTGYRNTGNSNTGYRNTGNSNTGDWNTGDWNTGDRNTGYRNTGDWNTGDRNTGYWNTGNWNTGYFNIDEPKTIRMFWKDIQKQNIFFPDYFYFDLCVWVSQQDMTNEEKKDNPLYWITDGYLKKYGYKEARKISFDNASKKDVQQTIELPNFDYKIFEEITGITKKMIQERLK